MKRKTGKYLEKKKLMEKILRELAKLQRETEAIGTREKENKEEFVSKILIKLMHFQRKILVSCSEEELDEIYKKTHKEVSKAIQRKSKTHAGNLSPRTMYI